MTQLQPAIAIIGIIVFCGFLIAAMIGDVKKFRITNRLNIAFALSFFVFAIAFGLSPKVILGHAIIGAICFAICFVMFFFGAFGGGDVKLAAASALWLGGAPMYNYVIFVAIFGGIIGVLLILMRLLARKIGLPKKPIWLRGILRRKAHMPYGVPLGLGGMLALKYADWVVISNIIPN